MPGSFCRQFLFFLCTWDPGVVDGPTWLLTSSLTCSSPGSLTPATSCLFFYRNPYPRLLLGILESGRLRLWPLWSLWSPQSSLTALAFFFFTTVFTPIRCRPQNFDLTPSLPPSFPSFPTRSLLLLTIKSSTRLSARPQHPTPTPPLAVGLSRIFDAVRLITPTSCPRHFLCLPSSSPYILPITTAVGD